MSDSLISLLIIGFVFAVLAVWTVRRWKYQQRVWALMQAIRQMQPLLCLSPGSARFQMGEIGGTLSGWKSCLLAITGEGVTLYPTSQQMDESFSFKADELRWFGRPQKYHPGQNEIWLHFERGDRWLLLKIRLSQWDMHQCVRALKAIASEEQNKAYRRRRPYIHYGPLMGNPASQDIHGAWTLEPPVELYLMPLFLVIMQDGKVLRTLPLSEVQQIGALKRLDAPPDADGLVRFQVQGEKFAFALAQHERFAGALAEAAKRTLEEPVMRKGREKFEDDDDESPYRSADIDYAAEEFIVGDDGELQARR